MSNNRFLAQFSDKLAAQYQIKLLAIRGYFKDMGYPDGNDVGIYDDLIVRCVEDETVGFRASTDPGWLCIEGKGPVINPNGCAMLCEGTHIFKFGKHDGHDALVQGETFYVKRFNTNGTLKPKTYTATGLDLHSGGVELNDVGPYSAGCQIIYCPEGYFGQTWLNFFEPLVNAAKDLKQKQIPYKLIRFEDMI